MITYDSPLKGQTHIKNVREQIQEDILTYIYGLDPTTNLGECDDDLCQIVVDNFKKLEV